MSHRLLAMPVIVCLLFLPALAQTPPSGSTKVMLGGTTSGPDFVVGELMDLSNYTAIGGIDAIAVGTRSCNIGDTPCDWISGDNRHPVIAQQCYRLWNGRFEMIGRAWLKHGFTALAQNYCDTCINPGTGTKLGVGCSDPYVSSLNGSQGNLGPRFEVDAASGVFSYPPTADGVTGNSIYKRLQVHVSDLDAASFPGARYFVEGQYVAQDDAAAGNKQNNASWKEVVFTTSNGGADYDVAFAPGALTNNMEPAIFAWKAADSSVELKSFDVPGDGRFWVGLKTTDNGNGTFTYEYAIQNLNSDRSAWKFEVPTSPAAVITNQGYHDADWHSGEPYANVDWTPSISGGVVSWATTPYATDPNANALRWASISNFRFTSDVAPGAGTLHLFKPGTPTTILIDMGPPAFTLGLPNGAVTEVADGMLTDVLVRATNVAGAPDPSTAELHYRVNGGSWITSALMDLGGGDFLATLPRLACGDLIDWYVEITPLGATLPIGLPAGAPFTFFGSSVTENHIVLVADDCETDQGFTVSGTALDGQWDRGIPVNFNRGDPAADYDGSGQCWLTDNDPTTSNSDVDGGETILTSPIYDVWGLDQAEIVFALWYQNKITTSVRDDSMQIEVSNGGPWVLVETISTNLTGWEERVIHVADHVLPNQTVQFRLRVSDFGQGSVVEAGLDAVKVRSCPLMTEAFAAGTVGAALGGPAEQVLMINGTNGGPLRRVAVGYGDPVSFAMAQPSTNPFSSVFIIWGVVETPPPSFAFPLPAGIGTLLFPPADIDPGNPALFLFTDCSGFSGLPGIVGSYGTPWAESLPGGIFFDVDVTLQGIVIDPSAPLNYGITNAVNFRVDSGL